MRTEQMMYECQSCGVVFFDRGQFELHDYDNYYDYTDTWDDARVAWELGIRRRALRKQLAHLGTYVEGRRLLDIGAGPGYLCRVATDEGWEACGIELSAKALRIGRQFLQVNYLQLEDVAEESLDVITCYHVLEHMERPDEFIKSLRSKLKTGGVVAVHVPHREPLSFLLRNWLNRLRGQQSEKLCALYVPEHISGFTQESLVKTFELFGFQSLMVKTAAMWSMYYDPFFLKNYLREKNYLNIFKHTLRCMVDNVGVGAGLGDWVVAHFRKI
jgi:2-polyprenyl-3-methyl-5-hydroxy-6-metoxy-1,4-benzoquinol methylase